MKKCFVCGFDIEDGVEICPSCGALMSNDTEEKTEEPQKDTQFVFAVTVNDFITADVFKEILTDNGIDFYVEGDGEAKLHSGFGGVFFSAHFYVAQDKADEAKSLYKSLEESDTAED